MIKLVPDLGAPAVVAAADILTRKYQPTWNEWVSYGLTALGYIAGFMNLARGDLGEFLTNLGVASLPLTARHIYDRVSAPPVEQQHVAASRYAFRGPVRQTVVPEFEGVKLS